MVIIKLPDYFTDDFIAAIPDQRELINNLLNLGVVMSYSLSSNRKNIWTILLADSIEEAEIIVDSFPIRDFVSYEIDELLFFANAVFEIPKNSLN